MFENKFRSRQQIFSDGFKLITRSILFFGTFAIILSGFIFLFPAFIGALIAILVLLAGLIALFTGYQLWKTKNMVNYATFSEFERIRLDRLYHYRPQTFRFKRW